MCGVCVFERVHIDFITGMRGLEFMGGSERLIKKVLFDKDTTCWFVISSPGKNNRLEAKFVVSNGESNQVARCSAPTHQPLHYIHRL